MSKIIAVIASVLLIMCMMSDKTGSTSVEQSIQYNGE